MNLSKQDNSVKLPYIRVESNTLDTQKSFVVEINQSQKSREGTIINTRKISTAFDQEDYSSSRKQESNSHVITQDDRQKSGRNIDL